MGGAHVLRRSASRAACMERGAGAKSQYNFGGQGPAGVEAPTGTEGKRFGSAINKAVTVALLSGISLNRALINCEYERVKSIKG